MKTVYVEAEVLEGHEEALKVRLLTHFGDPVIMVARDRVIEFAPASIEPA